MIVYFDAQGLYAGHIETGYPAPREALERIRAGQPNAIDIPPWGEAWYLPQGEAVPRPRPIMPVQLSRDTVRADGKQVLTVTGIEKGATVRIDGPVATAPLEADGEPLQLRFRWPGLYILTATLYPWADVRLGVTAESPTGARA